MSIKTDVEKERDELRDELRDENKRLKFREKVANELIASYEKREKRLRAALKRAQIDIEVLKKTHDALREDIKQALKGKE